MSQGNVWTIFRFFSFLFCSSVVVGSNMICDNDSTVAHAHFSGAQKNIAREWELQLAGRGSISIVMKKQQQRQSDVANRMLK